MTRRVCTILALVCAVLAVAGCAARISARTVRDEIVRQTGSTPSSEFELNLGYATTALVKTALGVTQDGDLPLAGLARLELAVLGLGERDAARAPIVFGGIAPPWGWESSVRWKGPESSALVLVRPGDTSIRDLVLVAGGTQQVVYARLAGSLSRSLPEALRDAVAGGGPDAVRRALVEATQP